MDGEWPDRIGLASPWDWFFKGRDAEVWETGFEALFEEVDVGRVRIGVLDLVEDR